MTNKKTPKDLNLAKLELKLKEAVKEKIDSQYHDFINVEINEPNKENDFYIVDIIVDDVYIFVEFPKKTNEDIDLFWEYLDTIFDIIRNNKYNFDLNLEFYNVPDNDPKFVSNNINNLKLWV